MEVVFPMHPKKLLPLALTLLLAAAAGHHADAATISGTFSTDDQVNFYTTTITSAQTISFNTTSYATGGFVPVLTLFSADGAPIAASTTGGAADSVTGLSNDAFLSDSATAGTYLLALSEFPNVATNGANDPFLFAGQGDFTPGLCPTSTGSSFLESDTPVCVQRTGSFALTSNVALSPVVASTPEPATWMLVLPATGLLFFVGKRSIA